MTAPIWCDTACHANVGDSGDYHRTEVRTLDVAAGTVQMWVDQTDDGGRPSVVVEHVGELDLTSVDARLLARLLLAAADIADGSAVTW